jgi:hypothetical protein
LAIANPSKTSIIKMANIHQYPKYLEKVAESAFLDATFSTNVTILMIKYTTAIAVKRLLTTGTYTQFIVKNI